MMSERSYPAPQSNPETQTFWDAAAEGVLKIKNCRSCFRASRTTCSSSTWRDHPREGPLRIPRRVPCCLGTCIESNRLRDVHAVCRRRTRGSA